MEIIVSHINLELRGVMHQGIPASEDEIINRNELLVNATNRIMYCIQMHVVNKTNPNLLHSMSRLKCTCSSILNDQQGTQMTRKVVPSSILNLDIMPFIVTRLQDYME